MKRKRSVCALLLTFITLTIFLLAGATLSRSEEQGSDPLAITAHTNQPNYRLQENVTISGNVTSGGVPANNLVVAVEVDSPTVYGPLSFGTINIGTPTQFWMVKIASIYMTDPNGNPIDTVQAGSSMWVGMNVTSTQGSQISIYATTTVYDASMVPIATNFWTSTMNAEQTVGSRFQMQVPSSASSGRAVIVGCVYSKEPAIGGIAYCPQSTLYYYLSGTQTGLLGITQPSSQPQTTAGVYTDSITLPPNPIQGKYSVYVLGQSGPVTISSATTSFTVQTTTGFPPQASFVYDPPNPVTSQTVSFDASSSSPGGYNDIITGYNWNFGDGTPGYASASSSTASHAYTQTGTYTVTLNVTNNEGLWCTTSKPITVSPVYGPTANFTWSPQNVTANSAITFDASNSKPGSLSTLTDYIWNFSDGTGLYDVPTLQEGHVFTKPGSYTVTLKVVDSQGRSASTSALLQVQNATWKLGDVNHDGKIDGRDITIVAKAFGSHGPNFDYPGEPASPNWNPIADLNGDNKVDGRDITIVAKKFGTDPP